MGEFGFGDMSGFADMLGTGINPSGLTGQFGGGLGNFNMPSSGFDLNSLYNTTGLADNVAMDLGKASPWGDASKGFDPKAFAEALKGVAGPGNTQPSRPGASLGSRLSAGTIQDLSKEPVRGVGRGSKTEARPTLAGLIQGR